MKHQTERYVWGHKLFSRHENHVLLHFRFFLTVHFVHYKQYEILTLSQERFLWREKHHRMDWPSNGYPNELFCSLCQPIVGHDGD